MHSTVLERQSPNLAPESDSCLLWALQYAAQGWRVFPLLPRDKRPLIKAWNEAATTDEATIREWWDESPESNIGLATGGRSGVVVVDIDGPTGRESFLGLQRQFGRLPNTLWACTSKGHHAFFGYRGSDLRNTAGRIAPGIDTRGDGGYVALPPSNHPSGVPYTWYNEHTPVAPLPKWLASLWLPPAPTRRSISPVRASTPYAQAALMGELEAVASALNGTRNDRLNRAAFSLGGLVSAGLLGESQVEEALIDAGLKAGLEGPETMKTVRSGLQAGMARPREVPV